MHEFVTVCGFAVNRFLFNYLLGEREREREGVSVCVCVFVSICIYNIYVRMYVCVLYRL